MEDIIEKLWLKYAKLFTIDGDIMQGALYINHSEFAEAMTEALEKKNLFAELGKFSYSRAFDPNFKVEDGKKEFERITSLIRESEGKSEN